MPKSHLILLISLVTIAYIFYHLLYTVSLVYLQRRLYLAFSVAGRRLRNNTLDDELRGCTNVKRFKKKLKKIHYCLSPFINANIVLTHCNIYVCLFHSILGVFRVTVVCFRLHTID